jgi:hypothetical protein
MDGKCGKRFGGCIFFYLLNFFYGILFSKHRYHRIGPKLQT